MRKILAVAVLLLLSGIAYGQALKKDAVMMIHVDSELELKPGVSMNAYIEFLNTTMKPELEKAWPGTKFVWLKGENPEKVNSMIRIWYFESAEVRDKYISPEFIHTDNKNMKLVLELSEMESEYIIKDENADHPPWPMFTSWLVL